MMKRGSQVLFSGWFCSVQWRAGMSVDEETGGGPEKKQETATKNDVNSETTTSEENTQSGNAKSETPDVSAPDSPESDVAQHEEKQSAESAPEDVPEANQPASETLPEETNTPTGGDGVTDTPSASHDEAVIDEVQDDHGGPEEKTSPSMNTAEDIKLETTEETQNAVPGSSRRMFILLGAVAAVLIVIGLMLGKTNTTTTDVQQTTATPSPDAQTATETKPTTAAEPSKSEATPTPADSVIQTVTPPPPLSSTPSAEPGMMGHMQESPMTATESASQTASNWPEGGESGHDESMAGMGNEGMGQETGQGAGAASTLSLSPDSSMSQAVGSGEEQSQEQKGMGMESGSSVMEPETVDQTMTTQDDMSGSQEMESSPQANTLEPTVSSPQKKPSVPEWVLPIWRAPLDDAHPVLPDYRMPGRQNVYPGNTVTAWLARTGQSGVALGNLSAYLALPGDVIPGKQGSIAFAFSPAAGIARTYSLPNPDHHGPMGRPVLAGYLLDSMGFDTGVHGAFRLVLNPVQNALAFAIRRPGGILEARWRYPKGLFADSKAWHTIVVYWGDEGMGIMVDGLEVAHHIGPVHVSATGPWFLGHGRPFGPDGPRSMMGRYKDVAVYNDPYPLGASK
ncbi:hypothetical protein [Desulfovibrio inopinatus]|uniref:hypothetical protein n=1 Tax=Desulfovibrio inopinatus TaxID=102109 RepID=UPI0004187A8D|nr:hypothetical protein [Desulfovibrio inopinatus]